MSKKPRKKKKRQPYGGYMSAGDQAAHDASKAKEDGEEGFLDGEELIHAPEGQSRMRFILTIVLVVGLLVIFVVPQAIQGAFQPQRQETNALTWNHPSQGEVFMDAPTFQSERNMFQRIFYIDPFMGFMLGQTDRDLSDEQAAHLIVLDSLALDYGIHIPDADVTAHLSEIIPRIGGQDAYKGLVRQLGLSLSNAAAGLRRCMRIKRFLDLMSHIAATPDPDVIERLWHETHIAYAYDCASLAVEGFEEAARSGLPDDPGLEEWLGELPERERTSYLDPERRRVEFLLYRDAESTPAAGLLAAYPPVEGSDPDELARTYYDEVFFKRFQRPAEAEQDPVDGDADAEGEAADDVPVTPPSPYLSFEEVTATARSEAPIYLAMKAWLAERNPDSSDTLDLAAEAARLGLTHVAADEGLTQEQLRTGVDHGGIYLAGTVSRTAAGSFALNVEAEAAALSILRVLEVRPPSLPEFASIKDRVADTWVLTRSRELAREAIIAVRAGFPQASAEETDPEAGAEVSAEAPLTADEETFRAMTEKASMTVTRRGWIDRSSPPTSIPDFDSPVNIFLRVHPEYEDMADGEIAEVGLDSGGTTVWLVRKVGSQEVPIEDMLPIHFSSLERQSAAESGRAARDLLLGDELERAFGLKFLLDQNGSPEPAESESDS